MWQGHRREPGIILKDQKKKKVGEFRISKEAEISKRIQSTYFM